MTGRRLPIVGLIGLTCMTLGACGRQEKVVGETSPLVRTVVAGDGAVAPVAYTGVVRARVEADLGFRVPGRIVARLVDPGAVVHQGQPLMRLDAADLGLARDSADQRLRATAAEFERADADAKRYAALVASGAVSRAEGERTLAAQRSTAANLKSAQASAKQAANELTYAELVADADGVVTDVLAQPGQVVAAGTPIMRLAHAGAREALVAVPETAVAGLPQSASARVYGAASSGSATLREVAGAADPMTRTYAARYVLAGAGVAAPLGATVTISFSPEGEQRLQVPLAALHDAGAGPGVWIVGEGRKVSLRAVRVVALGEEMATIAPGTVRPGDRVVALGAQLLREGETVRLAEPST